MDLTDDQLRTLRYYCECYPQGAPVHLTDHGTESALEAMGLVRLEPHPAGAIICYATDEAMRLATDRSPAKVKP